MYLICPCTCPMMYLFCTCLWCTLSVPVNCFLPVQSGCTETEKQKLLDQIGRLTAQVYAGEEAINYREEKLKKVEEENKKIKEELNNVVPVLRAQVRMEI